jgi:hypothetical protein
MCGMGCTLSVHQKECRKSLGCAFYIGARYLLENTVIAFCVWMSFWNFVLETFQKLHLCTLWMSYTASSDEVSSLKFRNCLCWIKLSVMSEGYLLNKVSQPVTFCGDWEFYFLIGDSTCSRSTCKRSIAWTAEVLVGEVVSSTTMSK